MCIRDRSSGDQPPVLQLFSVSFLHRLVNAGYRIKAAGLADIRQALGNDAQQKSLIVSHIHIPFGMGGKLRLAAALRRKKAAVSYTHLDVYKRQIYHCSLSPSIFLYP